MSNNCLVTKLKGVVDNPDLEIFGCIKIRVNTSVERMFTIYDMTKVKILEGSGSVVVEGVTVNTEYDLQNPGQTDITMNPGNYTLGVFSKYDVSFINQVGIITDVGFNLEDISYVRFVQISACSCFGTYKNKNKNITHFNLWRNDPITPQGGYVDLDSFAGTMSLHDLRLQNLLGLSGSVEALSGNTGLTVISTPGTTGGTGDIVTLCTNMVNNGRIEGRLYFDIVATGFTYQGVPISSIDVVAQITGGEPAWSFAADFSPSFTGGFKFVSV